MTEITAVKLPAMGEGIHEARVNSWLKQEGAVVQQDEPLLEVSTDKVDTEIVAPCQGVLSRILVKPEQTVAIGTVLAEITSDTASAAPTTPPANAKTKQPRLLVSPLVRRMAAEHDIDLTQVRGSGLHGRITVRDIEVELTKTSSEQERSRSPQAAAVTPRQASPEQTTDAPWQHSVYTQEGREYQDGVEVRRERMSRMRSLIAAHMTASVRISPHVTTVFEIDVERVGAVRQQLAAEFQQRTGLRLTWTACFAHITALCLKKFPLLNVSLDGNDILWKNDINIGCAVALENGLIVPVIKGAGDLDLMGTAQRLQELTAKAREGKLAADDVRGGTFTITNPGIYGSLTSNPIINQPQVAILGLGCVAPRAVAIDGMIAVRQMLQVSLTFDHRVIDGETGAKFLAAYREIAQGFSA